MAHLFDKTYTRRELLDLIGDMSQVAHARKGELTEGNERGADLIEVFNASGFCFSVLPGRSLDIASAQYKGMSLCFRGNTGDVGPSFYEPQGYGWMRGFYGGLVLTCGMTFTGHPEICQPNRSIRTAAGKGTSMSFVYGVKCEKRLPSEQTLN
jgi:hypothetical protein